jgi:hypothetical protein
LQQLLCPNTIPSGGLHAQGLLAWTVQTGQECRSSPPHGLQRPQTNDARPGRKRTMQPTSGPQRWAPEAPRTEILESLRLQCGCGKAAICITFCSSSNLRIDISIKNHQNGDPVTALGDTTGSPFRGQQHSPMHHRGHDMIGRIREPKRRRAAAAARLRQTHASEAPPATPIAQDNGVVNTLNNICVNNKALLGLSHHQPPEALVQN